MCVARKGGPSRTRLIQRLAREDEGADAAEYSLVAALIALAIVAGASLLGADLGAGYNSLANRFSTALPNL